MGVAEVVLPVPYDLQETLRSGQAFRWRRRGRTLEGYVSNAPVRVRARGPALTVTSSLDDDLERRVADYLRVSDPMRSIYRSIGKDEHVRGALERWRGLHLLTQDPWETAVSFIVSSASNVPKISRSIEKMCRAFGDEVVFRGERFHAFPTPERLARAPLGELRACELGYRARYVRSTAARVAEGEVDLGRIARQPSQDAQQALADSLDGIGPKVAACILLFSMGKDDAFPVDRWVQRCVSEWYFGGERVTALRCEAWGRAYFGRWAGYAQQYLFHDRRAQARSPSAGRGRR